MFHSRFNSQPIIPKRKRASLARGMRTRLALDPGFESFGEADDVTLAPGLLAHFDSTMGTPNDDLVHAAAAQGEYFQQPLYEARA